MRATQSFESRYARWSDFRNGVKMSQSLRVIHRIFTLTLLTSCFAVFTALAQKPAVRTVDRTNSAQASIRTDAENRPRVIFLDSKNSPATREVSPADVSVTNVNEATANYEQRAFEILNMNRKENGLEPLIWNADLAKLARLHSRNMAQYKFFNHAGLDGLMVDGRADQLGISKWRAIGENIAYNRGYEHPVEFAYEGWMSSASHKRNILSERWREIGIGIIADAEGTFYFTQVFIQR